PRRRRAPPTGGGRRIGAGAAQDGTARTETCGDTQLSTRFTRTVAHKIPRPAGRVPPGVTNRPVPGRASAWFAGVVAPENASRGRRRLPLDLLPGSPLDAAERRRNGR